MKKLVWYACYGSNINEKRFLYYIYGGVYNGRNYSGCNDKTRFLDSKSYTLPYELYFAKNSKTWENKGVAFLNLEKNINYKTYGKIYLVSYNQFLNIKKEEGVWYSKEISIGFENDYEILTFTNEKKLDFSSPSLSYLKIIVEGIKNSYPNLSDENIADYFLEKNGIKNFYSKEDILKNCF